jgi:hypothetical protein
MATALRLYCGGETAGARRERRTRLVAPDLIDVPVSQRTSLSRPIVPTRAAVGVELIANALRTPLGLCRQRRLGPLPASSRRPENLAAVDLGIAQHSGEGAVERGELSRVGPERLELLVGVVRTKPRHLCRTQIHALRYPPELLSPSGVCGDAPSTFSP